MAAQKEKERRVSHDFFNPLVANAIDFLKQSVSELQRRPKYSVINFCAGLELFLKARLILEHWSLVVAKPEAAVLEKFKNGEFHSVSMDETIRRLRNVAGETFTKHEERCFEHVREHRNKIVHFFHKTYTRRPNEALLWQIVTEQCKAWFYLHGRLTRSWHDHFTKHQKQIERLDKQMRRHRAFLGAKFAALEPEIASGVSRGIEYIDCASCGFTAARVDEIESPAFETECLVCDARDTSLRVPCPGCSETIRVDDATQAYCLNEDCEREIDLDYLVSEYAPDHDPKDEPEIYYCAFCEHHKPSVIPLSDRFLCLFCVEFLDSVERCGWCGFQIAGFDPEGSSAFGCFMCSHSIPWDRR